MQGAMPGKRSDTAGSKNRGGTGTGSTGPGGRRAKAEPRPGPRSKGTGVPALEQKQSPKENRTLESDLGGRTRLPKPRSIKYIDEGVWSGAQEEACGQVKREYCIPEKLGAYYNKMCMPGQLLLAGEIHRRTQIVYDYRSKKVVYRENRRTFK